MSDQTAGLRFRFTFAIGGNADDVDALVNALTPILSRRVAGFTVLQGTGVWRSDGNSTPPFRGFVEEEPARVVTFVADVDSAESALRRYKKAFRCAYRVAGCPDSIAWVNAETERVKVDHFDVSAPATAYESGASPASHEMITRRANGAG